jgi:hypothetical protein
LKWVEHQNAATWDRFGSQNNLMFRYWKRYKQMGAWSGGYQSRPFSGDPFYTDVTVQPWCDFSSLMLCRVLWLLMWWDDDSLSSSWFDSVCNLWHHPTYHSHPRPKRDTPPNTMGPPNIGCGRAFISDVFWNQIKHMGICIKSLTNHLHHPHHPYHPTMPRLLYLKRCKNFFTASTAYGTACAAAMLGDQESMYRLRRAAAFPMGIHGNLLA